MCSRMVIADSMPAGGPRAAQGRTVAGLAEPGRGAVVVVVVVVGGWERAKRAMGQRKMRARNVVDGKSQKAIKAKTTTAKSKKCWEATRMRTKCDSC